MFGIRDSCQACRESRCTPGISSCPSPSDLKWFLCQKHDSYVVVRALLESLANGDWFNEDHIEIYVPPNVEYDEESLLNMTAAGIARALSFKRFTMYRRSKWMGAEASCCELTLMLLLGNVHFAVLLCWYVVGGMVMLLLLMLPR